MSFNKLRYDTCAYKNELAQTVGTFAYVIDDCRYVHQQPRRVEFGLVAGNDVSIANNMVDIESDLKGQTRLASKCPTLEYLNPCPAGDMNTCKPKQIVIRGNPSNLGRVIDTTLHHLPPAQFARYVPIQIDPYLGGRMPK